MESTWLGQIQKSVLWSKPLQARKTVRTAVILLGGILLTACNISAENDSAKPEKAPNPALQLSYEELVQQAELLANAGKWQETLVLVDEAARRIDRNSPRQDAQRAALFIIEGLAIISANDYQGNVYCDALSYRNGAILNLNTLDSQPLSKLQAKLDLWRSQNRINDESVTCLLKANVDMSRQVENSDSPLKAAYARPRIDLSVSFALNSAQLDDAGTSQVDALFKALSRPEFSPYKIELTGHTDSRGDADYNTKLSKMRAETVKHYLTQHNAELISRVSTLGKGEDELLVNPERNEQDYAVNRRVTVELIR